MISKKYPTPVKHSWSQKKYPTPNKHSRSTVKKNTLHLTNIRNLKLFHVKNSHVKTGKKYVSHLSKGWSICQKVRSICQKVRSICQRWPRTLNSYTTDDDGVVLDIVANQILEQIEPEKNGQERARVSTPLSVALNFWSWSARFDLPVENTEVTEVDKRASSFVPRQTQD